MRIGIAQINPTLADIEANEKKIIDFAKRAKDKRCSLVVFPECALLGYHPFDLLERPSLINHLMKRLKAMSSKMPADVAVLVGLITPNPSKKGKPYYNSAALLVKGKTPRFFHKTLLPTGDVFDEARFIERGDVSKNHFTWKGKKFFLTICEDVWAWPDAQGRSPYSENPLQKIKAKPDLVINLSASPWFSGKRKKREQVIAPTAKHFKAPVLYVNLVGAQDEIIFDGNSLVMDPKGKIRVECARFEEDLNVFELDTLEAWNPQPPKIDRVEELRRALVLGLRDFCDKTGLRQVHLGLSGGIDSAVVACLAVDALGPSRVRGFALPGPYSAGESEALARELAKNLGVEMPTLEIKSSYEEIIRHLKPTLGLPEFGIVNENLQSRLRGLFLMAYSNHSGSLLLTTGNKSEYATGYATLYGDMCGGLAPLGDCTKEWVFRLAELYNAQAEVIPRRIIDRPPTAELRPNQKDSDSLPEYPVLDKAVVKIVEDCRPASNETERWLVKQVFKTEFKRWQAPPILKVTAHSFGRGRRYPVAHKAQDID